jgi:hypothetical protein
LVVILTGTVHTWRMCGNVRRFAAVRLTFEEADAVVRSECYDASTGKGEQRALDEAHVRKLRQAMEAGNYTPTPGSLGLREDHRKAVVYDRTADNSVTFRLEVNSDNPLPLTDGGHRLEAIRRIVQALREKLAHETDEMKRFLLQYDFDEALSATPSATSSDCNWASASMPHTSSASSCSRGN